MTFEEMEREMERVKKETQERGRASRSSRHLMFIAGVLIEMYRCAQLDIEREALAYAYALLVDAERASCDVQCDWHPHKQEEEQ